MGRLLLLSGNRADEAVLASLGEWQAPLANMQNRFLRRVARSADLDPAGTQFSIALPQARSIRGIVLSNNNLTTSARYRVVAGKDGTTIYDSGVVDAYRRVHSWQELRWGDPRFWRGRPSSEDLAGFTHNLVHVLPEALRITDCTVELDDQANPAGYLEIGRLFLANGSQPSHNYSYGGALGQETDTRIERSRTGVKFFDRREPHRVMRFVLENLPEQEALERWLEVQRRMGVDGEVFVIPDPDDDLNMTRRAFLGTLRTLTTWEQVLYLRATIGFEIEEIL